MKLTLILITLITCNSCLKSITCEEAIKSYSDMQTSLVLDEVDSYGNRLFLKGFNPKNKKEIVFFKDSGDWYIDIGSKFQKGDTVIKVIGEPIIRVYRKNERWKFTYKCKNSIVEFKNERF